jgi:redox-sensitive bicupin YhaK (pirin superfamily)
MLRCRSVAARAPLREEQPQPGLRTACVSTQLAPHLQPWTSLEDFHLSDERRGARPLAGQAVATYVFEDSRGALIAHDDGEARRIGPGDLHWLEASAEALHACAPEQRGHEVHGLRMLVQLRRAGAARSFDIAAARIPEVDHRGARVRVLVGAALGMRSPLEGLDLPVTVLDVRLDPGAELAHVAPAGHHAWALAVRGTGFAGPRDHETPLPDRTVVAFSRDGDTVRVRAGLAGLHLVLGHAAPVVA